MNDVVLGVDAQRPRQVLQSDYHDVIEAALRRTGRDTELKNDYRFLNNVVSRCALYVLSELDWTFATVKDTVTIEASTGNYKVPPNCVRLLSVGCIGPAQPGGWYIRGPYIMHAQASENAKLHVAYVTADSELHGRMPATFIEMLIIRLIRDYLSPKNTTAPQITAMYDKLYEAEMRKAHGHDNTVGPVRIFDCEPPIYGCCPCDCSC